MAIIRHYYIDEVHVFIDGGLPESVTITGSGDYDPNRVKRYAENMLRESYPESAITSMIRDHKELNLEEFHALVGNPRWLGNIVK